MLRRLFWLGLIGGAGFAGYTAWQRRSEAPAARAPEWPPFEPGKVEPAAPEAPTHVATFAATAEPASTHAPAPAHDQRSWVAPVDGRCPDGYPIKANDNSGIFHVPGGRFYERTVPERCYADAADAEADGYRRAKA
jgi:hypothetical protein